MLSVIPCDPCDPCDAPLQTVPGRGLVCPKGCDGEPAPYEHERPRTALREPRRVGPTSAPSVSDVVPEPAAAPVPTRVPVPTWEVFDVRWTKRGGNVVRLSKIGQLAIGSALAEQLGTADRVELLWDKAGRRIGLRAAFGPHAAKLAKSSKGTRLRVSLAGLLSHYGVPLPAKNLALKAAVEGGVLVFGLDQVGAG